MLNNTLRRNNFLIKIELEDAYLSLAINLDTLPEQKYLNQITTEYLIGT